MDKVTMNKGNKKKILNKINDYEFIQTHRELSEQLNDFATDEPQLVKLRETETPYNL